MGVTPAGQTPTPVAHIGGTKVRRDNRLIGKNVRITSGVMKSKSRFYMNA
jgi:transcription elongation factor